MGEATISRHELHQLIQTQLRSLLEQNNLEGAKPLLKPVQAPDIAQAIEELPEAMQAIAFRLLSKDEAIEVYEHLDSTVQQALIIELSSLFSGSLPDACQSQLWDGAYRVRTCVRQIMSLLPEPLGQRPRCFSRCF